MEPLNLIGILHKIAKSVLFLLLIIVGNSIAHADYQSSSNPLIYVQHIVLNGNQFESGTTITGSFILANQKNSIASDIIYKISLAGNYQKNGLAGIFYDSKLSDVVIYLNPKEQKLITFSYTLPQAVSGTHLGIQIQAMTKSGQPLTWADSFINVVGGLGQLVAKNATIETGGYGFTLQAGPMVKKNTEVFLNVDLVNNLKSPVVVNPTLHVFNNNVTGTLLMTGAQNTFIVPAFKTARVHISLPTFNSKPGVYVGTIEFPDPAGNIRAPHLEFRYIIEGQIVTLRSLTSNKQVVRGGDQITVVVGYTGTPYDITVGTGFASPTLAINNANLDVKIFDEHDILIAEGKKQLDFNQATSTTFVLSSKNDALAMRAEAVVTQSDGSQLSSFASILSPDYQLKSHQKAIHQSLLKKFFKAINNNLIIALAIFILITLSLAFIFLVRASRGHPSGLIGFFLITLVTCSFIVGTHVFANYAQYSQNKYLNAPAISENDISINPVNTTTYSDIFAAGPGQFFTIAGQVTAQACTNGLQKVKYYISDPYLSGSYVPDQPYVHTVTDNHNPQACDVNSNCNSKGEGYYPNTDQFSLGSYGVPQAPGHYIVNFQLKNIINRTDDQYYPNNSLAQCDVDNFLPSTLYPANDLGQAHANSCPINYLQNVNQGYIQFDVTQPIKVICSPDKTRVQVAP